MKITPAQKRAIYKYQRKKRYIHNLKIGRMVEKNLDKLILLEQEDLLNVLNKMFNYTSKDEKKELIINVLNI
jgi:hypothetical protein